VRMGAITKGRATRNGCQSECHEGHQLSRESSGKAGSAGVEVFPERRDLPHTGMWEEKSLRTNTASAFRPGAPAASPSAGCDRSSARRIAGHRAPGMSRSTTVGTAHRTGRPPFWCRPGLWWPNSLRSCAFSAPLPCGAAGRIGSVAGRRAAAPSPAGTNPASTAGIKPDRARSLHGCL